MPSAEQAILEKYKSYEPSSEEYTRYSKIPEDILTDHSRVVKSYRNLKDFDRTSRDLKSLSVSNNMFHNKEWKIKRENYKYFKRMDGVVQFDLDKIYQEKVPSINRLLDSVSETSLKAF